MDGNDERCALLVGLADDLGSPCATLSAALRHKVFVVRIVRGALAAALRDEIDRHECAPGAMVGGSLCCLEQETTYRTYELVRLQALLVCSWLEDTDPALYEAMARIPVAPCAVGSRLNSVCDIATLAAIDFQFKTFVNEIGAWSVVREID